MTIKAITANTILYCQNWENTVAFYSNTMKFPVLVKKSWFVEFKVNDSTRISVADAARTTIKPANGHGITLTFQISDIETVWNTLKIKNQSVSEIKTIWQSRQFFLYDPEGHRIEIWSNQ